MRHARSGPGDRADNFSPTAPSCIVVKSQIHAGGRGKGTFKSGFQGGVKLCKTADEVFENAKAMLGKVLVTKQTGPEGRLVSKLLVAAAADIKKELYLAVLLDRATPRPLIMASTEGGMDIEEVAAKHPEKIVKERIDPAVGLMPYQARKIAAALGLKGDLFGQRRETALGRLQDLVGMRRLAGRDQPALHRRRTRTARKRCWPWTPRSASMTTRCTGTRTSRRCAIWPRKRRWKSRPASST